MRHLKCVSLLLLALCFASGLLAENKALEFNAQTPDNDYVLIGTNVYNQLFDGASGFTYEGWIKPSRLATGTGKNRLLTLMISSTGAAIDVYLTNTGRLNVGARSGPTDLYQNAVSSSQVVTVGNWYHIAAVVDFRPGTKSVKAYVNGALVVNFTNPVFANDTYVPGTGGVDVIGLHPQFSPSYFDQYIGTIDEYRVWKYARTQEQIIAEMYRELELPQTDLIGYWKFNETSGTVAYDSSPSQKNGTLVNFPANPWVQGNMPDLRVYCDEAEYQINGNESIDIDVKIEGLVQNIRAYEVRISFDTQYLKLNDLTDFVQGTYLSDHGLSQWYVTGEDGVYVVTEAILGVNSGVTGPGTLFTFSLSAQGPGTPPEGTLVRIERVLLRDPLNQSIAIDNYGDARVDITGLYAYANIKVFLQGPYLAGGSMRYDLIPHLPLQSPYDEITLTSFPDVSPNLIVDWVQLQVRETADGAILQSESAFVLDNGWIVNVEGQPAFSFIDMVGIPHFLIIRHRNHLGIMSSVTHTFSDSPQSAPVIDMTILNSVYGGNSLGVKQIETGVLGLYAGDANRDGSILPNDLNDYWRVQAGLSGYRDADFDMDGNVFPNDINEVWRRNVGIQTQIPQ